jgi:predicted nucleic acid-binding Zn ribbon protein
MVSEVTSALEPDAVEEPAEPELSGVDLARVALQAARAAARRNGVQDSAAARNRRRASRRGGAVRREGRDPVGLGGALQALIADRAWAVPVAGGGVLADWPALAPELADHVQAVAHDTESGRLDLRPASPAWATQVRLQQAALLARIAQHAGPGVVRTIRVLPPGTAVTGAANSNGAVPVTMVPTPEPGEPSAGFRRAKAAHQAALREREVPLPVREALARQDAVLAANREPEDAFAEARYAAEQLQQHQGRAESVHAAALRRARDERAGRELPTITPGSNASQRLERTA